MVQLRMRSEREIECLITDALAQASRARGEYRKKDPDDPGDDPGPWREDERERMDNLIDALGLKKAVPNPLVGKQHREHSIRHVIKVVCKVTGFSRQELISDRRAMDVSRARHLMFYCIKEFCQHKSLPQIGDAVEKDHTTVMYGIKRARERIAKEPYYADLYQRISNRMAYEA